MTTRERDKLEKIAAGQTRAQKTETSYQTYKSYREEGLTQKKIAEIMGKSIRTMSGYEERLKREKIILSSIKDITQDMDDDDLDM